MSGIGAHKGSIGAVAVVLILILAAVVGIGGCAATEGKNSEMTTTTAAAVTTTAAGAMGPWDSSGEGEGSAGMAPSTGTGGDVAGTLSAIELASGQKIISDAQLEIQVESGKFQTAFDEALLIADRYGGYLVSSGSQASAEEGNMRSGTIAIRVPATSFSKALSDAAKLGEVKNRQIQTQDVTEEYVDLQARITNSQAHVQALLDLLARAKTVDEILQVQQVLTSAQQELEQLEGRLRYLDEHTSYCTLTMSIYEAGVAVTPPGEWGITKAFKDALHNFVDAVNAIMRGLGVLIPVLVVLAIIAYVAYRIWRSATRRNREREQARYQPYPQGWSGRAPQTGAEAQSVPAPQPVQPAPPEQPGTGAGD